MRYLCLLVVLVVLAGCGGLRTVTYRITGTTGNVDITLTNASGGTEQINVKPPWSVEFAGSAGRALYVSGQNKWDAGTVTCEILVGGQIVQTATSNTPFGVATCSGRI